MSASPIDPASLDWAALARPVPGPEPAGPSLRYERIYDDISEARRFDDPDLPQGVWVTERKRADWTRVATLCLDALQSQSKDLQLAAWLTEALVHMRGLQGALDGLKVVSLLVTYFWDDVHPRIEDGDIEFRLAPLVWLEEKLPLAIALVPITRESVREAQTFSLADWVDAGHFEKMLAAKPALREQLKKSDKPTRERIRMAVNDTPASWRKECARTAELLAGEAEHLVGLLDERCGRNAPSFRGLIETARNIQHLIQPAAEEKGEPQMAPSQSVRDSMQEGPVPAPAAMAPPTISMIDPSAGIRDRAQAYAVLSAVADYLMQVEPHSPVPYLIRRAVKWGNMSFADLLAELIHNLGDIEKVYYILGVQLKDNS